VEEVLGDLSQTLFLLERSALHPHIPGLPLLLRALRMVLFNLNLLGVDRYWGRVLGLELSL